MLGLLQPTKTKFIFFKYWNPTKQISLTQSLLYYYPNIELKFEYILIRISCHKDSYKQTVDLLVWFDQQQTLYKRRRKLSIIKNNKL